MISSGVAGAARWANRMAVTLCAMGAALVVSACGGASGAIEPFKPERLMVMGDELSVLLPDGRKYGVNAYVAGTATIDCTTHALWVQTVASVFGLTFAECNPNSLASTSAQNYARVGAKASDVNAQIDRALAAGAFVDKQMVTMYFGMNDVLELYAQYPARTQDALNAEARARGVALGQQVNRVARAGPAVLIVTAPDLGIAPFGKAETAAKPEPAGAITRARFLSQLTDSFNAGLRVTIINDGRMIGLVSSDQMVRDIQPPFNTFYGFNDLVTPMCLPSATPPNCGTDTLVTGADTSTWGYATDRLFGPALQTRLGQIAASRAVRNPF
jgi:lysophospholipase L1-like esterase